MKNPWGVDWKKSCDKKRKIYQVMHSTRLSWSGNPGGSQQSVMSMMALTMMTLSILITDKCLQAIRTQKSNGGQFYRIFFENVTVWHGCSMEYHRVFHEVKPLKISNLHTSMHILWLLCKWGDILIYNNQVWLFALQNPETSLCDH